MVFEASWAILKASWGHLGASWGHLGGILEATWKLTPLFLENVKKPLFFTAKTSPNINLSESEREARFFFSSVCEVEQIRACMCVGVSVGVYRHAAAAASCWLLASGCWLLLLSLLSLLLLLLLLIELLL